MDAQLLTVQKLEEKERALQGSLGGVEKELTLRSQALELNKRKVRPGPGEKATEHGGPQPKPRCAASHSPAHVLNAACVLVSVLSLVSAGLHFSLVTIVRGCLLLSVSLSEETEAQGGQLTCSRKNGPGIGAWISLAPEPTF